MRRPVLAAVIALALGLGVLDARQQSGPSAPASKPADPPMTLDAYYDSLPVVKAPTFTEDEAKRLTDTAISCIDHPQSRPAQRPYLWEGLYRPIDNFEKTRAFYGCFDWHSAVNSTWAMIKSLKTFPKLQNAFSARNKLDAHLGKTNVEGEMAYFKDAGTFELPYGYAWLLKVQSELLTWKDPDAEKWAANLEPLAKQMSTRLVQYFIETARPNRTGVHPNSAFAMYMTLEYTDAAPDPALRAAIGDAAKKFYAADTNCKTSSEPGPSDFQSPCLIEAAAMSRLMEKGAFVDWFNKFLPALQSPDFKPVAEPSDPDLITRPERMAAKSHVIGLAFMRGMEMNRIADALPDGDLRAATLRRLSARQGALGKDADDKAGYLGSHYLPSFTILYMLSVK